MRMWRAARPRISLSAVSDEHLANLTYFEVVHLKEPEFVGIGQHAALQEISGDMQISRITCCIRKTNYERKR